MHASAFSTSKLSGQYNSAKYQRNYSRKISILAFVWMVCFNDISSVKGAIVNFYNKVYREDHPGKPLLKGLSYDSISDDNG